ILSCVDRLGSTSWVAHFGYENRGTVARRGAIGTRNRFAPSPANRGQPTSFQPGRHADLFTVAWNGSPLHWSLDGTTATASDRTPRCHLPVTCPGDCNDNNPCTDDTCLAGKGCRHTLAAAGSACADADFCNGAEACDGSGSCLAATAVPSCNDGNS